MKWRKQMTGMWDDERVARLVKAGGVEGMAAFGLYCRVLDVVAGQMDGKTSECSVSYDVSRWSLLLSLRGSHVRHWLDKLALTTLVTAEWDGTECRVTIPNLVKYRDEYSSKSRQTPHKEQNRTDTEQINTNSVRKVVETIRTETPKTAAPKSGAARERGARFSLEALPPEWAEHASREYHWTPERIGKCFANFRDYWGSLPGPKGRKLDWFATWRIRCAQVDEATGGPTVAQFRANGDASQMGGYKPGRPIVVERPLD